MPAAHQPCARANVELLSSVSCLWVWEMQRKQIWWPALIGYCVRAMGSALSYCVHFLSASYKSSLCLTSLCLTKNSGVTKSNILQFSRINFIFVKGKTTVNYNNNNMLIVKYDIKQNTRYTNK